MISYETAVSNINGIPYFSGVNNFEKAKSFYEFLNAAPEGKIIHVAGTNGKGSVCAFLTCMHMAMGKKVCTFISPHLVDIRERFLINNKPVDKASFLNAYNIIEKALGAFGDYRPTYFEYLFFLSLIIFKEQSPDACIFETGLGGKLDTTNVIPEKDIAVITSISLDHCDILGDTVDKIAEQKAGILRPGTPLVCSLGAGTAIICKKAGELNSKIITVAPTDIDKTKVNKKNIDFCFDSRYYSNVNLKVNTNGIYQVENASLALRTCEELYGAELTEDCMAVSLQDMYWACRMDEVKPGIVLDGAHNIGGIQKFVESVQHRQRTLEVSTGERGRKLLLFSAVKDKQVREMCSILEESKLFDVIGIVPVNNRRTSSIYDIKEYFSPNQKIELYGNTLDGFEDMIKKKGERDSLYICGSLYLCGEIMNCLNGDKNEF